MTSKEPGARGADGLTPEELRRGRDAWWNEGFIRALLDAIPEGTSDLLEVGCGLGRVAEEVLPLSPKLSYVGVDIDATRIGEVEREFNQGPLANRTRFLVSSGEDLALESPSVGFVMFCLTLQHMPSPAKALSEATAHSLPLPSHIATRE